MILPLVVSRYSHQILYGPSEPCWILSDNVLHIQSLWKFFPWYIMPLLNCILYFWQPCSTFELVLFTPEVHGICFHDTLTGWTYAFLNLCEPESFHGSYSSGNSPGRFWHWNHFYLEQWMKGYALKNWESTLNPVFMPMDTMYNLSWKLLVKIITPLL